MHREWQIIDTGPGSATENMAIDKRLLENLAPSQPLLHFYDWIGDCATYGHFTRPEEHFNLTQSNSKPLQLAKRSTGGGIIFHLYDLAFSVLLPADHPEFSINTLENYAFVNRKIVFAIHSFSGKALMPELLPQKHLSKNLAQFCMAKPTVFDIIVNGKKVCGGAQRRTRLGFLHQGSISLSMPSVDYLSAVLNNGAAIAQAMQHQSYLLLGEQCTQQELKEARQHLKNLIIHEFQKFQIIT